MTLFVTRLGQTVEADEAYLAWMSNDLTRMLAAVSLRTNPIDRHHLLLQLVRVLYRQRKDAGKRDLFIQYARMHVSELPKLMPALLVQLGVMPRIPTPQYLATVLTEDGRYDEAIQVCEAALALSLADKTKSGYRGRIARIRKMAESL